VLKLNNVEVVYDRTILVLKGVSLEVPEQRIVTLLGSNGAGKSTTLKAISGLLRPERGEIIAGSVDFGGERIDHREPEEIVKRGAQLVLLGTGEEKYHQIFRELAKKHPRQLGIHILFDARMAKRIYAGSDIFLMPSRYEPCGLGQLISLRFGTVPLVRETGGLADTVQDFDSQTGEGTGFVFKDYETRAFLKALDRSLEVYRDPKLWQKLVKNGMKCDFSWHASAKKYLELYERVERKTISV